MSTVQKRIDFSCLDEAKADTGICNLVPHDEMKFDQQEVEMDSILTSSPLSKKLLQSPRKVKRHIQYAFKAMTDSENNTCEIPIHPECPSSPVSSRLQPNDERLNPPAPLIYSPPYKRVRALRLFDTPFTPKTLYEKSTNGLDCEASLSDVQRGLFRVPPTFAKLKQEQPVANINPFSPAELLRIRKRKRTLNSVPTSPKSVNNSSVLSSSDESMHQVSLREDDEPEVTVPVSVKRIALNESNISRYNKEFHELELIGEGEFGSVHKCVNRLDGCFYAVKRSIHPVAGSADEIRAVNEVCAHAVLGVHRHVVRYFSAWAEDNHMIIQNEFCGGGSLAEKLKRLREEKADPPGLSESDLRRVLLHVARGLHSIHHAGLVHLDIKPGNIFISHEPHVVPVKLLDNSCGDASLEDLEREEEMEDKQERDEVIYKIGDLGHVTCLDDPKVEEGDCRYLPKEILREDYSHLTKADIFSLGLTIFEAAGAGPLPKNGELWHAYRDGALPDLPYLSPGFNQLLKWMVHPVAAERPSASQLANHALIAPVPIHQIPLVVELQREVKKQRLHTEILERQLKDAKQVLNNAMVQQLASKSRRLVGLKVKRSMSTTNF